MSVISGVVGAVESKEASDAQVAAGDRATQAMMDMFYQSRQDTKPWRKAGTKALNVLMGTKETPRLLVRDPGKNFEKSPGYNFRLKEGVNALDKSAAALGRTGGAHEKGLIEYGQGFASNEYQKYLDQYYQSLNPYLSIAGLGQISAGNSSNAAIATGGNISDNALYQGNARASGYINTANAMKGASNTAIQGYGLYNALNTPAASSASSKSWQDWMYQ